MKSSNRSLAACAVPVRPRHSTVAATPPREALMSDRTWRIVAALLCLSLVVAAVVVQIWQQGTDANGPVRAGGAAPDSYLFCHWNVENFFDDQLDHRKGPGDREYDP